MKRVLSVFLSICLIIGLSWQIQFARAGEMDVTSEAGIGEIQKDAFTGEGKEFIGEDGSKTVVYNNGSMKTDYPDGTSEGIDRNGNLYKSGENGEINISLLDGSTAVLSPDNMLKHQYSDGSYEITNPDGSTVEKNAAGLVIEKDAEGNPLSLGFENGEKIEMVDGELPEGEHTVTGPNGETLTIHYDPNAEDVDMSVKFDGNGQKLEITAKNGEFEMHLSDPDGTNIDGHIDDGNVELSLKESNGDSFNLTVNDNTGEAHISSVTGGKEASIDMQINEDGSGQMRIKNEGTDMTIDAGADGSMNMKDNLTGAYAKYAQNSVDIRNSDGTGIQTDEEGNIIWADLRDENGNKLLEAKDGVMTITDPEDPSKRFSFSKGEDGSYTGVTPEGDTYKAMPDGTITKNGKPIESKDGAVYKNGEAMKEPKAEETMEEEPIVADGGSGLSASRVAGSYHLSGTYTWATGGESGTQPDDITMTVSAKGETTLDFSAEGEHFSAEYDPETGKTVIYSDGIPFYCTFSESEGSIQLTMTYDYTYANGKISGSRSGYKQ